MRAQVLLFPLVLVACTDPFLPAAVETTCGPARRLPHGGCCLPLESARGDGCVPRAFSGARSFGSEGEAAGSFALAIDGHGDAIAAWEHASQVTFAEERAGAFHFSRGLELPGKPHMIDVAAGPQGEAVVLFRQAGFTAESSDDGAIFVSRRPPGGGFVHEPMPVSAGTNAYGPRAAIGAAGEALLVFNQWTGSHYAVAWSTPDDLAKRPTFEVSQEGGLSPPTYFSNSPIPAVGADGSMLVSWYQSPGGDLMTYVSERLGRSGELSRPSPEQFLSAPGGPVDSHPIANPKPALHRDGQAAVSWTQEDGEGHVAVYLATRDARGEWYRPRDLHDSLDARDGYARCVQLAFDAEGALFVVWERDASIELAVRLADGTWRSPKGAPAVLSRPQSEALDPVLATGADGGVLLAYREKDADGVFRIVARRWHGDEEGVGPEEVLTPDDTVGAGPPSLALGGPDDRAMILWQGVGANGVELRYSTLEP